MKRQIPFVLVFLVGVFMIVQYFIPHEKSENESKIDHHENNHGNRARKGQRSAGIFPGEPNGLVKHV